MKIVKLTQVQQYAVQAMLAEKKTLPEMAKLLRKPADSIQLYIEEELKPQVKEEAGPEPTDDYKNVKEEVKQPRASDFMVNKTASQKSGVAIMTHAASERGDAASKGTGKSRYTHGAIYQIKKKKD